MTKGLNALELYYDALKKNKAVSQNIINNLGKILKFNWEPYFDKAIPVKVSREVQPRKAKIIGFPNMYLVHVVPQLMATQIIRTASNMVQATC